MIQIFASNYNALFKKAMESPSAAREFLKHYLPIEVKEIIDLETVTVEKDSFVEEDLKRNYSDLIYSINLKNMKEKAFIYTIIEHQSKPDY